MIQDHSGPDSSKPSIQKPEQKIRASKSLPKNEEAEVSLLGALLLDPESWDYVSDIVAAEDFYRTRHKKIFAALRELQNTGDPIDLITVSNNLSHKGELESVGGTQYIAELIDQTPSAANIVSYAKIIREKAVLRGLISTSTRIIERAFSEDYESFEGFLNEAEGEIFKISEDQSTEGLIGSAEIVKSSMKKLDELFHRGDDVIGVPSGFTELDDMTAGFHPGEMTIIAARPSMGKTAFSLNIASHVALDAGKVLAYFSVEMGKEQLMMRMLSQASKVNMSKLRVGKFDNNQEWPAIINAAAKMSQAKLYIDDTSGVSPYEIRAKCRRLKAQMGLDMIMVDYLQIMDLKKPAESRERAVAEISKTLKAIAKELQVPVIALAQLNRGVEGRGRDRRPMLSDLRESGSIEQDADVIMMLYREEYYERDNPDVKGQAEVIVGKHRNGPTGVVKLQWLAEIGQFANPTFDDAPFPTEPPPGPGYGVSNNSGGGNMPPGPPSSGGIQNFAPGG